MTSNIKLKIGNAEFDYEGETEFDTAAIKDLFSHLKNLGAIETSATAISDKFKSAHIRPSTIEEDSSSQINLAVGTIAARLSVSNGAELAIAAAAFLQFSQGMPSFKRSDLLDQMKTATAYYKSSMSGNLTRTLQTLVSSKLLNELPGGAYSLTAAEQTKLRARIETQ